MSLQTGKPWMIERSNLIESYDKWYQSPLATTNDATLAAFVSLRVTSADMLESLSPQRLAPVQTTPSQFGTLLQRLRPKIESWRERWLSAVPEKGNEFSCPSDIVNVH